MALPPILPNIFYKYQLSKVHPYGLPSILPNIFYKYQLSKVKYSLINWSTGSFFVLKYDYVVVLDTALVGTKHTKSWSKHFKLEATGKDCLQLIICFWTSAGVLSDIQYVCGISFSPWIEMLTFAVTRCRRPQVVWCALSLTSHPIQLRSRGKLQIFSTFSTATSFSRTCRTFEWTNRFLMGSLSCPRVRRGIYGFWGATAQLLHLNLNSARLSGQKRGKGEIESSGWKWNGIEDSSMKKDEIL